jgi:hypothetical protein
MRTLLKRLQRLEERQAAIWRSRRSLCGAPWGGPGVHLGSSWPGDGPAREGDRCRWPNTMGDPPLAFRNWGFQMTGLHILVNSAARPVAARRSRLRT